MRKYLFIAAVVLAIAVIASSALARDDDEKNGPNKGSNLGQVKKLEKTLERLEAFELPEVESTRTYRPSLFLGPQGQARIISGELINLGNATPAVDGIRVWGIDLRVDMGSARFSPRGTDRSDLQIGDKINVKGQVDEGTGVITASLVHALSSRHRLTDELFEKITKLIERLRELQEKAGLPLTPLPVAP